MDAVRTHRARETNQELTWSDRDLMRARHHAPSKFLRLADVCQYRLDAS